MMNGNKKNYQVAKSKSPQPEEYDFVLWWKRNAIFGLAPFRFRKSKATNVN